jgi:hypothetical protein
MSKPGTAESHPAPPGHATAPVTSGEAAASDEEGGRELLFRIAGAVGKPSLEALLHALQRARLLQDEVVLEAGNLNEFFRRQVRENLDLVSQAASRILGRAVAVRLSEDAAAHGDGDAPDPNPAGSPRESDDLMQRIQREPIVRSFLDIFPGPIKAEKMDP